MRLARVLSPDGRISKLQMWRPSAVGGKLLGLRKLLETLKRPVDRASVYRGRAGAERVH
jgi:hypothetical protein